MTSGVMGHAGASKLKGEEEANVEVGGAETSPIWNPARYIHVGSLKKKEVS